MEAPGLTGRYYSAVLTMLRGEPQTEGNAAPWLVGAGKFPLMTSGVGSEYIRSTSRLVVGYPTECHRAAFFGCLVPLPTSAVHAEYTRLCMYSVQYAIGATVKYLRTEYTTLSPSLLSTMRILAAASSRGGAARLTPNEARAVTASRLSVPLLFSMIDANPDGEAVAANRCCCCCSSG